MTISCGSEANVAEDIFQYYMSSIKQNNAKIDSEELLAYIDDEGVVRLSSSMLVTQMVRARGQSVEKQEEPINLNEYEDSSQEIWDRLVDGNNESLSDLLDLSSIDFTQSDFAIGSFKTQTTVNGRPCMLTIGNACMAGGNTSNLDNDCELNDFNEGFDTITDDDHWGITNNAGAPLVTFWFY